MRMPNRSGTYTPGSIVTTLPASRYPAPGGREPRRLVDLEADAVPEPVPELVAAPGRLDRVARHPVHLPHVRARLRGRQRRLLGGAHQLVGIAGLRVDLAGGECPRAVRAVGVEHAAEVDHDQRVARDHGVAAGSGMRQGAVLGGGDDRAGRKPRRRPGPGPVAPARGRRRARCARPGRVRRSATGRRRPRSRRSARMALTSPSSLTARSSSTSPPAGTSSTRSPRLLGQLRVGAHGHVDVVEARGAPDPRGPCRHRARPRAPTRACPRDRASDRSPGTSSFARSTYRKSVRNTRWPGPTRNAPLVPVKPVR